ncbi:hypothetical protein DFP72DRAFT_1077648 [Ephemerocybe angulata]|uniref:Uncharacterized protein n=1 Tax=Ephemerocybe angulata TaxID=980116 RepID=A0A8H6HED3_9AGAR|nr:hypothetical protein DFP72DRAFT_1077648 [Tulosesus angulatus]
MSLTLQASQDTTLLGSPDPSLSSLMALDSDSPSLSPTSSPSPPSRTRAVAEIGSESLPPSSSPDMGASDIGPSEVNVTPPPHSGPLVVIDLVTPPRVDTAAASSDLPSAPPMKPFIRPRRVSLVSLDKSPRMSSPELNLDSLGAVGDADMASDCATASSLSDDDASMYPAVAPGDDPEMPMHSMTLKQFVELAKSYYADNKLAELALLVSAGVAQGFLVDLVVKSTLHRNRSRTSVLRFYGNVYGVTDRILVKNALLELRPSYRWRESFRDASANITHSWKIDEVGITQPLHEIPNLCIATFDSANALYLMFPGLYKKRRVFFMETEEVRVVWEKVLSPALYLLPEVASDIIGGAPTPDSFKFDARVPRIGTVLPQHIEALNLNIRYYADRSDCDWLKTFAVIHAVRSQSELHRMDDEMISTIVLESYLAKNHLDCDEIEGDDGDWYIDVDELVASAGNHSHKHHTNTFLAFRLRLESVYDS